MKKMLVPVLRLVLALLTMLVSVVHTHAAELYVPTDYTKIQTAINYANDGDVVIVDVGTYVENINFLGKAITIKSTDPNDPHIEAATIIDGDQRGSVVTFNNGERNCSVLSGFNVQNGNSEFLGGGIFCSSSSPRITRCSINENYAGHKGGGIYCDSNSSPTITNSFITKNLGGNGEGYGGGIYCRESSPTIKDCSINNNYTYSGGGIYFDYYSNKATLTKCDINDNQGRIGGGIFCKQSSPIIAYCNIQANWSASSGGGIFCKQSSPIIRFCFIADSRARENGGGIHCLSSNPYIGGILIKNNAAANHGGGIYCDSSSPIINGFSINGNSAWENGGGIFYNSSSSPILINGNIVNNSVGDRWSKGGGIYCDSQSSPTIKDCSINNNSALSAGGGIYCQENSSLSIVGGEISDNSTTENGFGGGIHCLNTSISISNCIIKGNYTNQTSWGGGISFFKSSVSISRCSISYNKSGIGAGIYCMDSNETSIRDCEIFWNSAKWGAGIYCEYSSPTIVNCIVHDNNTYQEGEGGGIYCRGLGTFPHITNCTISGNSADVGAGIYCESSSPSVTNCILWNDSPDEINIDNISAFTATYSDIQG